MDNEAREYLFEGIEENWGGKEGRERVRIKKGFQLIGRSNFFRSRDLYIYNKNMPTVHLAFVALLLSGIVHSQITSAIPTAVQPNNKGMTFQATVWPSYETSWAGRFSCNNCNPFEGDQPCTKSLPILCISSPKSISRPFYPIQIQYTPFSITDGGYYDGWTGGVVTSTLPVRGSDITSYSVGDKICKGYFGNNSVFATLDSGFYMPFMNELPRKTWSLWDWNKAKTGGWNFWAYFNLHYRGRAWVWVKGQPNGNCGV